MFLVPARQWVTPIRLKEDNHSAAIAVHNRMFGAVDPREPEGRRYYGCVVPYFTGSHWKNRLKKYRATEDFLAACLGGRSSGFYYYQLRSWLFQEKRDQVFMQRSRTRRPDPFAATRRNACDAFRRRKRSD